MKKRNIVIIWVLILAAIVAYCIYNNKMPLNDIYVGSTFPPEDQKIFEDKLLELERKNITNYGDAIEKARMYDYLWYPGKALLVYQNFQRNSTWEYIAVLTNVSHLYKEICEVAEKLNRQYCKQAIDDYEYVIEKYNQPDLYKDIVTVYLKLWNKTKAKKYYELYTDSTGRSEAWIEKKLNM